MLQEVLLVDDDDVTLMLCETVIELEDLARSVTKFKNGQQALDHFEQLQHEHDYSGGTKAPDLILLDLNMPVKDGWAFLEEFESRFEDSFPETKVYILTSSVDPLDFSQSKIYNSVIGFINKPLIAERVKEIKANEHITHLFDHT